MLCGLGSEDKGPEPGSGATSGGWNRQREGVLPGRRQEPPAQDSGPGRLAGLLTSASVRVNACCF